MLAAEELWLGAHAMYTRIGDTAKSKNTCGLGVSILPLLENPGPVRVLQVTDSKSGQKCQIEQICSMSVHAVYMKLPLTLRNEWQDSWLPAGSFSGSEGFFHKHYQERAESPASGESAYTGHKRGYLGRMIGKSDHRGQPAPTFKPLKANS